MNSITFNTHQFVKKLQANGLSIEQSEAIVDVIRDSRNDGITQLATKAEMQQFKSDFKHDLELLEQLLKSETNLLKYGMGYLIAAITGLIIKTIFFN